MYLSSENHKFYSDAIKHIKNCQDEFWDIDEQIGKYLDEINENEAIRTMYSKKGRSYGFGSLSYLQFCYTKKKEIKIEEELIPLLKTEFNSKGEITFDKNKPILKPIDNRDRNICLKYISHSEYWNVWNYKIQFDGSEKYHKLFWEIITEHLKKL